MPAMATASKPICLPFRHDEEKQILTILLLTRQNQTVQYRTSMSNQTETLGDVLPREIQRNMELLTQYAEIGSDGAFGSAMIRRDLDIAVKALADGDIVGMISSLEALRGNK